MKTGAMKRKIQLCITRINNILKYIRIKKKLMQRAIIKCASHGSGGLIKASCSEFMRFCKKNIHISNVINTFLSLPLSRCTQRGGTRNTQTRINSNITVFTSNKAGQDKAGQTNRNTGSNE